MRERTPWQGQLWPRFVTIGLLTPVWIAIFTVTVAIMSASSLASATGRHAAFCWRYLGKRRRLIWGMVAAFPAASIAADVGLLPNHEAVVLLAGGTLAAFFGLWLALDKLLAQRRWRRGNVQVVDGGWQAEFAVTACRIDDTQMQVTYLLQEAGARLARLEQVEAAQRDLFLLLSRVTENTQVPWPDHEATAPMRRLRSVPPAVSDGEAGLVTPRWRPSCGRARPGPARSHQRTRGLCVPARA